MKTTIPDSVWLFNHPDYPPNPPTRTFNDALTLHSAITPFNILHHPGHTAPQTSVYVPAEGVVFTGDNVFYKCKTFVQEGDPWEWLAALTEHRRARRRDDRPGPRRAVRQALPAGAGADHRELDRRGRGLRRRGLSRDEAVAEPLDVRTKTRTRSASGCSR